MNVMVNGASSLRKPSEQELDASVDKPSQRRQEIRVGSRESTNAANPQQIA
jgi:hypothetical protein